MIIIDTDVIIWVLRGEKSIRDRIEELASDKNVKLFITPIQITEIYAGLKEKERIDTSLLLETLPCVEINEHVGRLAGEYLNIYRKSHGVTLTDAMVGACAKINGLKLWTLNRKHYPMLEKYDFV
jgi:predicted nucleic acid-binding protein